MSEPLRPWDAGYAAKIPTVKDATEIARMGGLAKAARKAAGLPPKPVSDGTGKKGAKVKNKEKAEKYAAMTEETIPLKKKMFLDRFIGEYLHDFNSSMAYIRAGGSPGSAASRGPDMLRTGYVQIQLRALSQMCDEENLVTRSEVLMGIKKEANYYGEDGSSSARVRAWGMLAKIKGMEAPTKVEQTVEHIGGVMLVPVSGTIEEWEAAAAGAQLQLKNDVRK